MRSFLTKSLENKAFLIGNGLGIKSDYFDFVAHRGILVRIQFVAP